MHVYITHSTKIPAKVLNQKLDALRKDCAVKFFIIAVYDDKLQSITIMNFAQARALYPTIIIQEIYQNAEKNSLFATFWELIRQFRSQSTLQSSRLHLYLDANITDVGGSELNELLLDGYTQVQPDVITLFTGNPDCLVAAKQLEAGTHAFNRIIPSACVRVLETPGDILNMNFIEEHHVAPPPVRQQRDSHWSLFFCCVCTRSTLPVNVSSIQSGLDTLPTTVVTGAHESDDTLRTTTHTAVLY